MMNCLKSCQDLQGDFTSPVRIECAGSLYQLFEILALHELHDEIERFAVPADVIDIDNVSMRNRCRGSRFPIESLCERRIDRVTSPQELDCDIAFETTVACSPCDRRGSGPDLAKQFISFA